MGDFIEGLSSAYRFLSGQRMLPSGHVIKHLTRLNLYAPLLQAGLRPDQIEYLLQNPDPLAQAFEGANQAYMEVSKAADPKQAMVSEFGKRLLSSGISAGLSAGGAITGTLGLLGWVASAAWKSSEDCVDGVSSQWLNLHRARIADKINEVKTYFHDGMDYIRNGRPQKHGVSLRYAPVGVAGAELEKRRNKVRIVVDWLVKHNEMSNASLLTIYPKIMCMCDNILAQPGGQEKMEAGGVFYASIKAQAEVIASLTHRMGYARALYAECAGRGGQVVRTPTRTGAGRDYYYCKPPSIVGTSGGGRRTETAAEPSPMEKELARLATRYGNDQPTGEPTAMWARFLRASNIESLTRRVQYFTGVTFGRRVVGTDNQFYEGPEHTINPFRQSAVYLTEKAQPENIPNHEQMARDWSYPVAEIRMVNMALLDTIRRIGGALRNRVTPGEVDPSSQEALAEQQQHDDAWFDQRQQELAESEKKAKLVKGVTYGIGGVALLVGGIVGYKLLTGRKQSPALPAPVKNPWQGAFFPFEGKLWSEIPGNQVEVDYDIATAMLDWHAGQADPIYAVGSSTLAGKPVPADIVQAAVSELERLYNRKDVRGEDREQLADILDYFMVEHGIEG